MQSVTVKVLETDGTPFSDLIQGTPLKMPLEKRNKCFLKAAAAQFFLAETGTRQLKAF